MVTERTHKEISELLRRANPQAYDEHRRKYPKHGFNGKRYGENISPRPTNSSHIEEKRDTISQALVHNTWHAPHKKA